MERVARGFDTGPVERGLARIPPRIRELVSGVDFLCGVDPVFAGLHDGAQPAPEYGYGTEPLAWSRVAHTCYPTSPSRVGGDRNPTIVLPASLEEVYGEDGASGAVVVHELGHWLDYLTGFGCWPSAAEGIMPVSDTAVNWWEAYAEAFTAWLYPELYPYSQGLVLRDSPVLAHFEGLAR